LTSEGKVQHVIYTGVVKRFNPEAITGAKERLLGLVPEGESEHATQVLHTVTSPRAIRLQDDFGIRRRHKAFWPQFSAELSIVVNFAVVGNPITRPIVHGLFTRGQVDNT
jgi:hypothetical protein